jgi:hypothetical protein
MKWIDKLLRINQNTLDLNQLAGTYDLFTGVGQEVLIESLTIKMPNEAAGGAITSISIQTKDNTPLEFISAAEGAVANLTAEAQLGWVSQGVRLSLAAAKTIQLTINGGAHGSEYLVEITVTWRPVKSGGYLSILPLP